MEQNVLYGTKSGSLGFVHGIELNVEVDPSKIQGALLKNEVLRVLWFVTLRKPTRMFVKPYITEGFK